MANEFKFKKNFENETIEQIEVKYSLCPTYYNDFHCTMHDCKYNCCAGGWDITMSKKDYLNARRQQTSEPMDTLIKDSIRKKKNGQRFDEYAEIRCSKDGICPLLTEESLCSLQLACGYEALPAVCKVFPRTEQYTAAGYFERSLSTACEAVLELLWNLPDGIDFTAEPLPKDQWATVHAEKSSLYIYFNEIRELCIDLLQDRQFTVAQRIYLMGILFEEMQESVDKVSDWLKHAKALLNSSTVPNLIQSNEEIDKLFFVHNAKTIIDIVKVSKQPAAYQKEFWKQILHTLGVSDNEDGTSITLDYKTFQQSKANFFETFGDIEYFFENLAVSVFFRTYLPYLDSKEDLWKGYVNFCNIYSLFRFISFISCQKASDNPKDELHRAILMVSRSVIHSAQVQKLLRDSFFKNENSSLAHMAILLSQ